MLAMRITPHLAISAFSTHYSASFSIVYVFSRYRKRAKPVSVLPQYFQSAQSLKLLSVLNSNELSSLFLVENQWTGNQLFLELFAPNAITDTDAAADELSKLKHPSIAAYQSSGVSPEGQFFVLREAISSHILKPYFNSSPWYQPLPSDAATSVLNNLADAVNYLDTHGHGHAVENALNPAQVALSSDLGTAQVVSIIPAALANQAAAPADVFSFVASKVAPDFDAKAAMKEKVRTSETAPDKQEHVFTSEDSTKLWTTEDSDEVDSSDTTHTSNTGTAAATPKDPAVAGGSETETEKTNAIPILEPNESKGDTPATGALETADAVQLADTAAQGEAQTTTTRDFNKTERSTDRAAEKAKELANEPHDESPTETFEIKTADRNPHYSTDLRNAWVFPEADSLDEITLPNHSPSSDITKVIPPSQPSRQFPQYQFEPQAHIPQGNEGQSYEPASPKKKRKKGIVITCIMLLLMTAGIAGGTFWYTNQYPGWNDDEISLANAYGGLVGERGNQEGAMSTTCNSRGVQPGERASIHCLGDQVSYSLTYFASVEEKEKTMPDVEKVVLSNDKCTIESYEQADGDEKTFYLTAPGTQSAFVVWGPDAEMARLQLPLCAK